MLLHSEIDIAFARDSTILAPEPLVDYPAPYEIPPADSAEPPSLDNSLSDGLTEYIELYSTLLEYFDLTCYGAVADGRTSSSSEKTYETSYDYFDGKWIRDRRGPLYNSTTCGTIKEGQNCITRGRPDSGYLYWRWKPSQCSLPRFKPQTFLQLISNKHVAFVGDSMPRNQLESLLCMLSTGSTPNLVYLNGDDNIIVLSIRHWFLHPTVYYKGGSVLGCHYCPGLNHTEIGFYDVLRKALRTTLNNIIDRRGGKGYGIDVIVTAIKCYPFEVKSENCYMLAKYQNKNPILQRSPKERPYA
ncbi:Protein ALTERED XYLOGLUCAN 4 [Glycine max]|nr:Protein ALTERED XYLOGLUCAN 4 [Glycine max]